MTTKQHGKPTHRNRYVATKPVVTQEERKKKRKAERQARKKNRNKK